MHRLSDKFQIATLACLLIFSVCCRKDERNGLGQTVLVLQPTDYVPTGQCYACGAEYDTAVSVLNLGGDEDIERIFKLSVV